MLPDEAPPGCAEPPVLGAVLGVPSGCDEPLPLVPVDPLPVVPVDPLPAVPVDPLPVDPLPVVPVVPRLPSGCDDPEPVVPGSLELPDEDPLEPVLG